MQQVFEIPRPTSSIKLQRFLGLVNYFSHFIPYYSIIRQPLNKLVSLKPFKYDNRSIAAFYALKDSIRNLKSLFHVNYDLPIYLAVDASISGIGAYLFQLSTSHISIAQLSEMLIDQNNPPSPHTLDPFNRLYHQPLGFISHNFAPPQLKWSNVVREAYAIAYSILAFHQLLHGAPFIVLTDHKNFLSMFKSSNPVVTHAFLKIQDYNFLLSHIQGINNICADSLSRLHLIRVFNTYSTLPSTEIESVRRSPRLKLLIQPHTLPTSTQGPTSDSYSTSSSDNDSVINHEPYPSYISPFQPHHIDNDHLDILRKFHTKAGHHGINQTLFQLKESGHYWPSMRRDLIAFISTCPICQLNWRVPRARHIMRRSFDSYDPFYSIEIDFLGPYPSDSFNNQYYLVVVCNFTKYVRIYPCVDRTTHSVTLALLDIYSLFTLVRIIASDQAPEFMSSAYQQFLLFITADPSYTLAYRHQKLVERTNREIVRHIIALDLDRHQPQPINFHIIAALVMRIINLSIHTDTNCSSHELVFGIHSTPHLYPESNSPISPPRDSRQFYNDLLKTQIDLLNKSRKYQAERTDLYLLPNTSSSAPTFNPGDYVTVTYPERRPSKERAKVMGPFIIIFRNKETYTVLDMITDKEHQYHVSRLRIYSPSDYHNISPRDAALMNSDHYVVNKILQHRGDFRYRKTLEFLVSFEGISDIFNEWISCNSACRLPQMDNYLLQFPHLRRTVNRFKH